MDKFEVQFFEDAYNFIEKLGEVDRAKVLAHIKIMETDFDVVHIKMVQTPIKELIVKKYRLLFFIKKNIIYFVNGFIKKSQKTPLKEIEKAQSVYNMMK